MVSLRPQGVQRVTRPPFRPEVAGSNPGAPAGDNSMLQPGAELAKRWG
jgi:hypothetical protein